MSVNQETIRSEIDIAKETFAGILPEGRARSLALTKLDEAEMWALKGLQEQGVQPAPTVAEQLGVYEMPGGSSSMAILARKLGLTSHVSYPSDPSDLRRCINAHGKHAPEVMRGASKIWDIYLDHWDELIALWELESSQQKCPKLYERMHELQEDARQ